MSSTIRGPFEVTATSEPPFDVVDGVSLARGTFEKKFHGALEATGHVTMLGAGTTVKTSAAYVALERVSGAVEGRTGTFVLQHCAVMSRAAQSLTITVVPDSGTGQLAGLSGKMGIEIAEGGKHTYVFEYAIEG